LLFSGLVYRRSSFFNRDDSKSEDNKVQEAFRTFFTKKFAYIILPKFTTMGIIAQYKLLSILMREIVGSSFFFNGKILNSYEGIYVSPWLMHIVRERKIRELKVRPRGVLHILRSFKFNTRVALSYPRSNEDHLYTADIVVILLLLHCSNIATILRCCCIIAAI